MNLLQANEVEQCECNKFLLSVHDTISVLNGKWKLPILFVLKLGDKRFGEISKKLNGITDKVLSKELKELEVNELISKIVYESEPPRVVYSLTEHGLSLGLLLQSMKQWGDEHRKKIMRFNP